MKQRTSYHTRQGKAILSYLESQEGTHVTVEQIAAHFDGIGAGVGLTTIYRHLDKLSAVGLVRKHTIDGTSGACYEYIDEQGQNQYHLKCEVCGNLQHLECEVIGALSRHVFEDHRFQINPTKTVFYGTCKDCTPE